MGNADGGHGGDRRRARAQPSEDRRLCLAGADVSREQRLDSCTAVIKAGLEMPHNLAIAFNNRGNVHVNLKDYDRAVADYDRAIELNPKYAVAFNNRGFAYRSKGRYDRAIQDYDRAIEISPSYALAFFGRGLAFQDKAQWDFDAYLNEGRYEDLAIRDYDEAIRLNPKNAAAFNNRGNAYVSKRMYDRAIAGLRRGAPAQSRQRLVSQEPGQRFAGSSVSTAAPSRIIARRCTLKIDELTKNQIEKALKELGVAG